MGHHTEEASSKLQRQVTPWCVESGESHGLMSSFLIDVNPFQLGILLEEIIISLPLVEKKEQPIPKSFPF